MIWVILSLAIILAILTYGSFDVGSGIYLRCLCRQKNKSSRSGKMAITFDDGVDECITPKVLDILDKHRAKATFFIIGQKAAQHPDLVREIRQRGHSIGNHSFYHSGYFPLQKKGKIIDEIKKCNQTLSEILDQEITLFRPPFGITNPMIAKAVKECHLTAIGWSIRSLDTLGHPLDRVAHRVSKKMKEGQVVLLHDNREGADILLEKILTHSDSLSLRSVTINELFNVN